MLQWWGWMSRMGKTKTIAQRPASRRLDQPEPAQFRNHLRGEQMSDRNRRRQDRETVDLTKPEPLL
jgi:hypothetical protein